ncbi:MAG: zinc dependent phospholipase C family protein [Calditerrivibrio sp.]|nr:zinc dependent phospholipase C family protein [Calditerrivibrio sp.]
MALDILETTNFSLIRNQPAFFILGNIFPDFFNLFKDISIFKKNLPTHSWKTVSLLFENSKNDEERSFSYGYSAHLAADIIAHNKMIPQHTLLNNKSRLLSHFLVELASISNEKKIKYILMDALDYADSRGEVFLRTFNIEKKYFNRELFILKSAIKMQSVLKISEVASYIKNRKNPSFSIKCSIYEEKSLEMAKKSVENGFSELMKYDPSGKEAMKKAKEVRTKLLNNFSKKGLKKHDRENLFNNRFDPNRIND